MVCTCHDLFAISALTSITFYQSQYKQMSHGVDYNPLDLFPPFQFVIVCSALSWVRCLQKQVDRDLDILPCTFGRESSSSFFLLTRHFFFMFFFSKSSIGCHVCVILHVIQTIFKDDQSYFYPILPMFKLSSLEIMNLYHHGIISCIYRSPCITSLNLNFYWLF